MKVGREVKSGWVATAELGNSSDLFYLLRVREHSAAFMRKEQ